MATLLNQLEKTVRGSSGSGTAMHSRIADTIRQNILRGHLQPGSKLPTSTQFTEGLGVSPVTIQNAIRTLSAEGLVVPRRRLGTFVSDNVPIYDGKVVLLMGARPMRDDTFLWQYLEGVTRAFTERRLEASVEFSYELTTDFDKFEEYLSKRNDCLGAIVLAPGTDFLKQLEYMSRPPIQVIVMSAAVDSPVVSWGHSDDYGMCYDIACRLADMGHKRIAMAYRIEPWKPFGLERRRDGFLRGIKAMRLQDTASYIHQDDLESLISGPNRPTALLMDLALKSQVKVLEMIHAKGLSIPKDISVIGYDAVDIKTVDGLQLAAVQQPFEQVAREIARHITIRNDGRFEMTIAQHFLPGQTLAKIETR